MYMQTFSEPAQGDNFSFADNHPKGLRAQDRRRSTRTEDLRCAALRSPILEVKTKFGSVCPWCHKMRPTERGQEVVQCNLVRDVDGCQS